MIRTLAAGRRAATTSAVRCISRDVTPSTNRLITSQRPGTGVWGGLPASREFATRGWSSPFGRKPGSNKGKGAQRAGQNAGVIFALAGVAVAAFWKGNQDEAPYTNRKRFMLVDRDGYFMRKISESAWASVKQEYARSILPETHQASRTVAKVGARIAKASGLEGCKWEFIVVKDATVNAFALPGGKVVVFAGLFEATPNMDALASVIGHEVGHVVANHGGEKLSKVLFKEAMLLGFILVTGFEYSKFARSMGNLMFDLPNSREMEREADYIGMQLMAKACFDPREMPRTFARMDTMSTRKGVSKLPAYMSTHPADDERVANQDEWMDSALETRGRSGCPDLRPWGIE